MQNINIPVNKMPTSSIVVNALDECFSQDDIDLRDITNIAKQDPVVLANILFLVNEVVVARGNQVVNTLSAAINLVGLEPLKQRLLSIKAINSKDKSLPSYELVRTRMYSSACLTLYWAQYMGQTSAEEMYCASMFTGMNDLSFCLQNQFKPQHCVVDFESIESIQALYNTDQKDIDLMPDSIQCIFQQQSVLERLKLSILVYELLSSLEYGYSSQLLNQCLKNICDYVGIGIHRVGYDLARHLVDIERSANYHVFNHSRFLLSTNVEGLDPLH